MPIPTEPIGSIPRPPELLDGMQQLASGRISAGTMGSLYERAIRDTVQRFEATGSPVITDGEQSKPSFATYPIHGLETLAPDGVTIPFADGHVRQLPRLTAGPFRYRTYADTFLEEAKKHARVPLKQAVISASAISLLYPQDGIPGYSRDAFLRDLVGEAERDIRGCLTKGAYNVQIDFTKARSSCFVGSSLTACWNGSRRRRESGLGSTHAPAATKTRPTARTWITGSSCPISSSSTWGVSTSSSRARRTAAGSSGSSRSTRGPTT